ncbi:hypothetical protein [Streptosporangium sp. 'caverna']|uniref:hypothetical protein n=1 Tax=Streptosporangium sp. 'caverna' TaxID=2202249 RepID=UPI000D7E1806|nr:hypothetical protein [Streptosporangium sp. 'caverna']AWS47600.1 hypothetical protein DKM19_46240 [Streptosporangium sp. 'caverna']
MASDALEVRQGWRIVGLVVRCVLLVVLLWGGLVTLLSLNPVPRTQGEFRAAAAAGRITAVEFREQNGDLSYVRWTEGPLVWRWISPRPLVENSGAYTVTDLRRDLGDDSVRTINIRGDTGGGTFLPSWPFQVRGPTAGWVAVAWVLTILIMLGSTPRLGNRWAWFWMFGIGQVGAILFLLLEPRPLWFRAGEHPAPRKRLEGGFGFLTAIGFGMITAWVTFALGQLVNLAVG